MGEKKYKIYKKRNTYIGDKKKLWPAWKEDESRLTKEYKDVLEGRSKN